MFFSVPTLIVDGVTDKVKPMFLEKISSSIEAVKGSDITLEAQVKGVPSPKVDWYKGSIKITHGDRYDITKSPDNAWHMLVIKNVEKEDEGLYKCEASNSVGLSNCRTELIVNEKQCAPYSPYEVDECQISVAQGDELNLILPVRAYPSPKVTWYKDDELLRDSVKIKLKSREDSQHLFIPFSELQHSGTYKCTVKNPLGTLVKSFDVKIEGNHSYLILSIRGDLDLPFKNEMTVNQFYRGTFCNTFYHWLV